MRAWELFSRAKISSRFFLRVDAYLPFKSKFLYCFFKVSPQRAVTDHIVLGILVGLGELTESPEAELNPFLFH